MSQPAFDTARHEIWYTDGGTGFYVLRVDNGVWPQPRGHVDQHVARAARLPGGDRQPHAHARSAR